MLQVVRKEDQFNDVIFGGRFFANKPVFQGRRNTQPYSCLYYWSNAYVEGDCEFGLHPHQGFEIMTFLFEGGLEHYDTAVKAWTPLRAGDFQIIQSNSGIRHGERIRKGSRAFQIWFDPGFATALHLPPAYVDHHAADFTPRRMDGYDALTYVGEGSPARALTPRIAIKRLQFSHRHRVALALDERMGYTFYVLGGGGSIDGNEVKTDDAVRMDGVGSTSIDFSGELFYIEAPGVVEYETAWRQGFSGEGRWLPGSR